MSLKIQTHKDYEILETLGEGVSSDIYKGIRKDKVSDFHQLVAIKVYKSGHFEKKFQNELKNLSKLHHESLPRVIDWHFCSENPVIVTEYLDGCDLGCFIKLFKDQLTIAQKRYIIDRLFRGLKALYERGLCHGDLKPSNVMLTTDGQIKLIDICLDDYGHIYATPEYTAPEVLAGSRPDFRSDLYSLGLIAKAIDSSDFNSLLNLKPGLRSYVKRRILREGLQIQNLAKLILNAKLKSKKQQLAKADQIYEKSISVDLNKTNVPYSNLAIDTLEMHSSPKSYQDSEPDDDLRKNLIPSFKLPKFKFSKRQRCLFALSFIFTLNLLSPPHLNLPRLSKIKLRSLKAVEVWDKGKWHSLPYDYTKKTSPFAQGLNIKLRDFETLRFVNFPIKAYEEKLIAIDAL